MKARQPASDWPAIDARKIARQKTESEFSRRKARTSELYATNHAIEDDPEEDQDDVRGEYEEDASNVARSSDGYVIAVRARTSFSFDMSDLPFTSAAFARS